jgi:lantibiotic modifying enzyme
VNEIIKNGRELGKSGRCPLMFEWYGEKYWGAAHGLAGIMHVLMDMDLKPDEVEDVKGTLRYMINNRFPSGNYPTSEEDKKRDVLVHWCHGAPGVALTLVKAARVRLLMVNNYSRIEQLKEVFTVLLQKLCFGFSLS